MDTHEHQNVMLYTGCPAGAERKALYQASLVEFGSGFLVCRLSRPVIVVSLILAGLCGAVGLGIANFLQGHRSGIGFDETVTLDWAIRGAFTYRVIIRHCGARLFGASPYRKLCTYARSSGTCCSAALDGGSWRTSRIHGDGPIFFSSWGASLSYRLCLAFSCKPGCSTRLFSS